MGVETRVQTAIEMREVAEPYIRRRAISHLQVGGWGSQHALVQQLARHKPQSSLLVASSCITSLW
jgi:hypothetical protein